MVPRLDGSFLGLFQLYEDCKRWGVLPAAGGLLEQDLETMEGFGAIERGLALGLPVAEA